MISIQKKYEKIIPKSKYVLNIIHLLHIVPQHILSITPTSNIYHPLSASERITSVRCTVFGCSVE